MKVVFIPPLIAVLISKEQEKGSALTEQEVLAIRDDSTAVVLDMQATLQLAIDRGYHDIDPEKCWQQWCKYRNA